MILPVIFGAVTFGLYFGWWGVPAGALFAWVASAGALADIERERRKGERP